MTETEVCPICKSAELEWGKQSGHAKVIRADAWIANGSNLYHLICSDCGHVLRSKVDDPSRFKPKR